MEMKHWDGIMLSSENQKRCMAANRTKNKQTITSLLFWNQRAFICIKIELDRIFCIIIMILYLLWIVRIQTSDWALGGLICLCGYVYAAFCGGGGDSSSSPLCARVVKMLAWRLASACTRLCKQRLARFDDVQLLALYIVFLKCSIFPKNKRHTHTHKKKKQCQHQRACERHPLIHALFAQVYILYECPPTAHGSKPAHLKTENRVGFVCGLIFRVKKINK